MHSLKYLNNGLCALWLATLLAVGHSAHAQFENEPAGANSIYQYSALAGNQRAYLWIPPKSQQVRGLIISFANLLEQSWLESAIIRQEAARDDLGILLIEKGTTITPAFNTTTPAALLQLLKNLAQQSGYPEIQHVALLPIEHSVHGLFTWNVAHWAPERTIAAIPVKTFPLPDTIDFSGVPVCYIIGETDEWPAVNDGRPWDRDYVWSLIRNSATRLRTLNPQNLVGVITDPGGGHLDWSDRLSRFMALYIHKACLYRLPKKLPANGPVKLNTIKAQQGWLTDTGGMLPDQFAPAPYLQYQGDVKTAYWFFDEETARAAAHFCGDRIKRDKQMLSFLQDDSLVAVSRQGYVPLVYLPQNDSMSFKLQSAFYPLCLRN